MSASVSVVDDPDKIAFPLRAAAIAVGVSSKTLQRAIARGDLRAKNIGGRRLVRRVDLCDWLDGLPDA